MLYAFFGNDAPRVRQKAFDFLRTISNEDKTVTYISSDDYTAGMIADLAGSVSLFGGGHVYVFDTPSEDQSVFLDVLEHLPLLEESFHQFILIESAINASEKKKIQKHASSVEEITADKKERFNAFLLTEAFLRRDKKSLWLLLTEAWKEGLSNEEIIGVLFWQIKILRLVEKTNSADEAGQKPFVYQKAKRALSNFKSGEVDQMSRELLTLYHEGHAGKVDTQAALEAWVLKLRA